MELGLFGGNRAYRKAGEEGIWGMLGRARRGRRASLWPARLSASQVLHRTHPHPLRLVQPLSRLPFPLTRTPTPPSCLSPPYRFLTHLGSDDSNSSTFLTMTPPSSSHDVLRSTTFRTRFVFLRRPETTASPAPAAPAPAAAPAAAGPGRDCPPTPAPVLCPAPPPLRSASSSAASCASLNASGAAAAISAASSRANSSSEDPSPSSPPPISEGGGVGSERALSWARQMEEARPVKS